MTKAINTLLIGASLAILPACMHHSVETVNEVKPIHVIIDINVKVDKALNNYFAQEANSGVIPDVVSIDDALKPVDPANLPPKERMMGRFVARGPELKKLKAAGVVGEDANGYIKFVTDKRESEPLVASENADRRIIYDHIAKNQGATSDKVAQVKARRNAQEAKSGEYLQDASGKWSQKN